MEDMNDVLDLGLHQAHLLIDGNMVTVPINLYYPRSEDDGKDTDTE